MFFDPNSGKFVKSVEFKSNTTVLQNLRISDSNGCNSSGLIFLFEVTFGIYRSMCSF